MGPTSPGRARRPEGWQRVLGALWSFFLLLPATLSLPVTSAPANCVIWNEASPSVLFLCARASRLDHCPLHPVPGTPSIPVQAAHASKCFQPLCLSLPLSIPPSQVLPPYPQHT